jgi:hypothetical protein
MAAIYSNGGNRWNILGFNFTKRNALSSVYKISMELIPLDTDSIGDIKTHELRYKMLCIFNISLINHMNISQSSILLILIMYM